MVLERASHRLSLQKGPCFRLFSSHSLSSSSSLSSLSSSSASSSRRYGYSVVNNDDIFSQSIQRQRQRRRLLFLVGQKRPSSNGISRNQQNFKTDNLLRRQKDKTSTMYIRQQQCYERQPAYEFFVQPVRYFHSDTIDRGAADDEKITFIIQILEDDKNNKNNRNNHNNSNRDGESNGKFPVGSLTPDILNCAEEVLDIWVSQRNKDGFEKACLLLDRLAREQEMSLQQQNLKLEVNKDDDEETDETTQNQSLEYIVRPYLLNRVVDCWRTCWSDKEIDTSATDILSYVDGLRTRGLESDGRTMTLIIDGMISRGDPSETSLIAQYLFDRTMDSASEGMESRPDSMFITAVIRAWGKSGRVEAPEVAEGLLQLMYTLQENGSIESAPTAYSYAATMEAWNESRHPDAAESMARLLDEMKGSNLEQVFPNRACYNLVINGWTYSKNPAGPRRAYDVLQEMIELYVAGNRDSAPNASNFSRVMYALARRGDTDKAIELYGQLEELHSITKDGSLEPDIECQKSLLIAYCKGQQPEKAEAIFDRLINQALEDKNVPMLSRSYFVDLLVAWCKHRNPNMAAEKSQSVLLQMIRLAKSGFPNLMPDTKSFEKVIRAWSFVKDPRAVRQTETLIETMEETWKATGRHCIKPNNLVYEKALVVLSRSGMADAPKQAEAILRDMEARYETSGDETMKPRRGAYTTTMYTMLRSRRGDNSHKKVRELFETMAQLYHQGDTTMRPDLHAYDALIESYSRQGDAKNAQITFDTMLEDYLNGNKDAMPDVRIVNKLLRAWNRCKDDDDDNDDDDVVQKANKAEEIIQKMIELDKMKQLKFRPDRFTYIEMIELWANYNNDNNDIDDEDDNDNYESDVAAINAQRYLKLLQNQNTPPTITSYISTIDAWTKSHHGKANNNDTANNNNYNEDHDASIQSKILLNDLLYQMKRGKIRLPEYDTYIKFLQSIAKSKIPKRNEQAQKILATAKKGKKVPKPLLPPLSS